MVEEAEAVEVVEVVEEVVDEVVAEVVVVVVMTMMMMNMEIGEEVVQVAVVGEDINQKKNKLNRAKCLKKQHSKKIK